MATARRSIESRNGARRRLAADVVLAADGAGSEVRRALAASGAIAAREELLDHGYKELTLAARDGELRARAERAAHLAARRVHADRAAESRPHVHGDAVPAASRRAELRERRRGAVARVLRARVRGRRAADPGARARVRRATPSASSAPCTAGRGASRTAFCSSATRRTRSCRSTARA